MKRSHLGKIILVVILILAAIPIVEFAFFKKEKVLPAQTEALHEAMFYDVLSGGRIQCQLCPNRCILAPGQRGLCKVRENQDGKLYSLVYGELVTIHVDPIEKKPFYHFLPGSKAYSIATAGCNLACKYCQNWDISQRFPEDVKSMDYPPEKVVEEALSAGAESIAFTYSEPTVFYEYMLDVAKLAQQKGLRTVVVSSGFINPEPLRTLIPYLDAYKVDLKTFDDKVYQELIGGRLQPVLDTLKVLKESEIHLEIVNLLVPTYTDDEGQIREMCTWIKENLGAEVPVHFSRFHPLYRLENLPPTPEETVKKARRICMDVGLKFVYTGNIPDIEGSTTYCPDNGKPLIVRKGYTAVKDEVDENGKSPECPTEIPGVWR